MTIRACSVNRKELGFSTTSDEEAQDIELFDYYEHW